MCSVTFLETWIQNLFIYPPTEPSHMATPRYKKDRNIDLELESLSPWNKVTLLEPRKRAEWILDGQPAATTTWAIKQRNIDLWESDANVERYAWLSGVSGVGINLVKCRGNVGLHRWEDQVLSDRRVETGRGLMMEWLIKVLGLYPRILELLKGFQQGMG